MAKRKTADKVSQQSIFATLEAAIKKQIAEPNIFAYQPHAKQKVFHDSEKKGRLYIGGNRSGKTVGGVVEDIYWARGSHPHKRLPDGPIRGRVVGVDYLNGVSKILLPQFGRWCPPSILKNGSFEDSYNKELRTLWFNNGSFIEFMSYDQDLDKFAGTSRHFIHFDEEPPKPIFNECGARLIDTDGSWWITMTPVEGMSWVYDDLYVPGVEKTDEEILVVQIDMAENPYLPEGAGERYLKGLDEDERKARKSGTFVQLGGLVFKSFNKAIHTIPKDAFDPRNCRGWQFYLSIDDGWNNPTCVLWHGVSPDGDVVTFAEHYAAEMTIEEHAKIIKATEAMWPGISENIIRTGDPAMKQTGTQVGVSKQYTYAENGIMLALENIPRDVSVGIDKMQQYLRINPMTGKPKWIITDDCINLVGEMERLRWATYSSKKSQYDNNAQEKIHKKNDHAPDSARYFFTLLPDLAPYPETPKHPNIPGLDVIIPTQPRYDQYLAQMQQPQETKWKIFEGSDTYSLEYE